MKKDGVGSFCFHPSSFILHPSGNHVRSLEKTVADRSMEWPAAFVAE
jgi:hypothetical protein